MLRNALKTSLALNLFGSGDLGSADNLSGATQTEKKVDLSELQNETGWERVQRMFETDEFGELSKELVTTINVGAMSLFVGAVYGGVMHSRLAYTDFIKNNQATVFNDHIEAKKRLQDAVTKSFGRGAFKWAWRLSLFTTTFVGISTTISVYRGKTGMIDFVAAGLLSGALYKFNMGPRGWVVGGGLGCALGLIAGGCTLGILSLSGMTMEEARYWQYHWRHARENYLRTHAAELLAKRQEEVWFHTQKVGDTGNTLDSVDKKQ